MHLSSEKRQKIFNDLRLGEKLDRHNRTKASPDHHNLPEADELAPRAVLNSSANTNSTQAVRGRQILHDLEVQPEDKPTLKPDGVQTLHDLLKQREDKSAVRLPVCNLNDGSEDTQPIPTATKEAPKLNSPTLDQLQGQMEQLEAQLKTYMRSARGARPPSFFEKARSAEE
jgi:hypothetical protein